MSEKELKLKLKVYKFLTLTELINCYKKFKFTDDKLHKILQEHPVCASLDYKFITDVYVMSDQNHKFKNNLYLLILYNTHRYSCFFRDINPDLVKIGLTKEQYEVIISHSYIELKQTIR